MMQPDQTAFDLAWQPVGLLLSAACCFSLLQSLSELPPAAVTSRHTVTSNTHSCTSCSTISSLLSLTEALILGNIFFFRKSQCNLFFHEWPSRQANPSSDGQTRIQTADTTSNIFSILQTHPVRQVYTSQTIKMGTQ